MVFCVSLMQRRMPYSLCCHWLTNSPRTKESWGTKPVARIQGEIKAIRHTPIEEHHHEIMPVIKCHVDGCKYSTPNQEAVIGAALLNPPGTETCPSCQGWEGQKTRHFVSGHHWGLDVLPVPVRGLRESYQVVSRVIQLLECCDEQLRRDLTRNAGGTLAAIKRLAVREENVMVARVALHHMKQDRDESIRAFVRGQAGVCKYTKVCPGCNIDVSYTRPY